MVLIGASKTGLRMAKTRRRKRKTNTYGSRILNDIEKKYSIGKIELLAVVRGFQTFRLYTRKKVDFYTDNQALELLIKRSRCNKQYSA